VIGPPPIGPATLVASTTCPRLLRIARPVISSDTPAEYTSAVSMKFPPASRNRATIRAEVGSSQPHALFTKVIVPRQRFETLSPVRPSLRSFIVPPWCRRSLPHLAREERLEDRPRRLDPRLRARVTRQGFELAVEGRVGSLDLRQRAVHALRPTVVEHLVPRAVGEVEEVGQRLEEGAGLIRARVA